MYFNLLVIYLLPNVFSRNRTQIRVFQFKAAARQFVVVANFLFALFKFAEATRQTLGNAEHLSIQMTAFTFRADTLNVRTPERKSSPNAIWPREIMVKSKNSIHDNRLKMPMHRYTQLILANWNVIAVSLAHSLQFRTVYTKK